VGDSAFRLVTAQGALNGVSEVFSAAVLFREGVMQSINVKIAFDFQAHAARCA